jgi:hypothetical protein
VTLLWKFKVQLGNGRRQERFLTDSFDTQEVYRWMINETPGEPQEIVNSEDRRIQSMAIPSDFVLVSRSTCPRDGLGRTALSTESEQGRAGIA